MIVELGNGYKIDSSDGMNWTLTCDIGHGGKKDGQKLTAPRILGYHANLRYALEAAVRHGLAVDNAVVTLKNLESHVNAVAA